MFDIKGLMEQAANELKAERQRAKQELWNDLKPYYFGIAHKDNLSLHIKEVDLIPILKKHSLDIKEETKK